MKNVLQCIKTSFIRYILMKKIEYYFSKRKILRVSRLTRQYGITTKLIEISFKCRIPICVFSDSEYKEILQKMIQYTREHYIYMSMKDISDKKIIFFKNEGDIRGRRIYNGILVDVSCTDQKLKVLYNLNIPIYGGVMYK